MSEEKSDLQILSDAILRHTDLSCPKIQGFNSETARGFSQDLHDTLESFARKRGLTVNVGRGTYNPTQVKIHITFTTHDCTGKPQDKFQNDFRKYHLRHGLRISDLGRRFLDKNGKAWELHGINKTAHKYPIICKDLRTGHFYKFTAHSVRERLQEIDKAVKKTDTESE